jgi:hypothetical protein
LLSNFFWKDAQPLLTQEARMLADLVMPTIVGKHRFGGRLRIQIGRKLYGNFDPSVYGLPARRRARLRPIVQPEPEESRVAQCLGEIRRDLRTVTGRALIDLRQLHFDQIKLDGGLVTTAQHSSDGTARQRAA